jgi:hypothetical protein
LWGIKGERCDAAIDTENQSQIPPALAFQHYQYEQKTGPGQQRSNRQRDDTVSPHQQVNGEGRRLRRYLRLLSTGCHQCAKVCQLPLWKSMDGAKRQLSGGADEQQQQQQLSSTGSHSRNEFGSADEAGGSTDAEMRLHPMTCSGETVRRTAALFDRLRACLLLHFSSVGKRFARSFNVRPIFFPLISGLVAFGCQSER